MPNPFNPINNYNMGNIQDMYRMFTSSQNPYQLFQNIASRNPQLSPILNMIRNGINPQQIFNNMCQQRGINPQQFINSITNNNN